MKFSSVAHPQTNDLVEVTNWAILEGLKRRVTGAHDTWVDELPSILWASRTTPKTATGESPISLEFGSEAVLPPKVLFSTPQVENFDDVTSRNRLRAGLDLVEERRADAYLRTLSYRRDIARLYN